MNTQQTPLVQKLILVMLLLIFGGLVLLLVNGRKQIEVLREGNGPALSIGDSNNASAIHKAFPSLRSSRNPRPTNTPGDPPAARKTEPVGGAKPVEAPVVEQPPIVLPAATVIESTETVAEGSGVSGRVVLVGVPPQEKVIRFDQTCGAMQQSPLVTTRHYVVSPDGGLANVFVYISKGTGVDGKKFPTPTTPVLLDQKNCMYQPYVIGAMVNQPIQIRNSDPILHNVHAMPKNDPSSEFNFAEPLQGQIDERKFRTPEVFVKFKCDVHDWMFAYVAVASNPYFAVTDTNGMFQLPSGLPPGGYEITATHLKAGSAKQRFVLKKDANVRLEFRLKADVRSGVAQR